MNIRESKEVGMYEPVSLFDGVPAHTVASGAFVIESRKVSTRKLG